MYEILFMHKIRVILLIFLIIFQLTEMIDWNSCSLSNDSTMMMDEDYMDFMSDTLFTTITSNQPFAFPDTREIGKLIFIHYTSILFV